MKRPKLWAKLPADWRDLTPGRRLVASRQASSTRQGDIADASGLSVDRVCALESDWGKLAPSEILPLMRSYNLSLGAVAARRPGAGSTAGADPRGNLAAVRFGQWNAWSTR
ncbi:hypothetical protein [Microbulbifer epialgicus]|uniref:Helix-turn-helix domain-containing protein n=1 Tax=Microbulbifer epialgicus TaxID=393907 RepID=A0ABV4P588_9GAMM